jgi:fumarate hydratase, class II
MDYRIEKDTLGEVKVPKNKLWGAQTERSRNNFKIGDEASMPKEIFEAFAFLKKAAAYTNCKLGILSIEKRDLIAQVCDEILTGQHEAQFPLVIWQTGSGTQTNMNVNEVIANRAQQIANREIGKDEPVLKANDDVNQSQSSNDTFPTAMHIAAYRILVTNTIPSLEALSKLCKIKVALLLKL